MYGRMPEDVRLCRISTEIKNGVYFTKKDQI